MLDKTYNPKKIEDKWSAFWIKNNLYSADESSSKEGFSIVIPPPNVTGSLHVGHALNNTLQDIICRYQRMRGKEVLWVPGTDHAGIATQSVVERMLESEGIDRKEIGREAFVEKVWQWKEKYGGRIIEQLKRLGCSCDWERERFTMDPGLSKVVREVFVKLYNEGLIYKGDYMVNWDPVTQSAISDLEVEYPDEPEDGFLYGLDYPVIGEDSFIRVDTTRPETMLGDTAVAVHPEDKRYSSLIGKEVELPLVGRTIPIIADDFVDPEFGTGAVKITPAHDLNDFEAGKRHRLPSVQVIGYDAKMTDEAGVYAGLDRFECRKKIIKDLEKEGVLKQTKPHKMKVGRCHRSGAVIEPMVSSQWFVKMEKLAADAAQAVRESETTITPKEWSKTYFQWMDNIRDWCISRQLWWGHRIPVWYCEDCNHEMASVEDLSQCFECSSKNIRQDQDVLDTWFSSALWPFSTMGWPEKNQTIEKFYPTSLLVTGFDILFFWVARMMMMGIKLTEKAPFADVYLHAMVRDEHGKKMSKSKGNVIDPLDIVDELGADALRFGLAILCVQGRDVNLSMSRLEGYRNFINKVWNASRYVLTTVEDKEKFEVNQPSDLPDDLISRWIRSRLAVAREKNLVAYEEYQFSDLCSTNYHFFWDEFCAWYLEAAKLQLREADEKAAGKIKTNLLATLDVSLRLLHPVIPFVTEELWAQLPEINSIKRESISLAPFPVMDEYKGGFVFDSESEEQVSFLKEVVTSIRTMRGEKDLNPSKKLNVMIEGEQGKLEFLLEHQGFLKGLARLEKFAVGEKTGMSMTKVVQGVSVHLLLDSAIDFKAEKERISKIVAQCKKEIARINSKLSNQGFIAKAPEEVVAKEKVKLVEFSEKLEVQKKALAELESA